MSTVGSLDESEVLAVERFDRPVLARVLRWGSVSSCPGRAGCVADNQAVCDGYATERCCALDFLKVNSTYLWST